jgi:hypothetical protein
MNMTTENPLLSFFEILLLVAGTGTAWFIALHPRFIWEILHGGGAEDGNGEGEGFALVRTAGMLAGALGLWLLFLPDWLQ